VVEQGFPARLHRDLRDAGSSTFSGHHAADSRQLGQAHALDALVQRVEPVPGEDHEHPVELQVPEEL
jgi:hypothetical protein